MNIKNTLRASKLNNYVGGKRPSIRAIVLHDTAGSGTEGDARYLANDPENRGVSVDFVVLRDGTIFKLNPDLTRFSTNHAGRNTYLRDLKGNQIGEGPIRNALVNAHTIGIELSHNAVPAKQTPEWPIEQVIAVADLCKDLCEKFALTREAITTHAKVITDGSRSDPRKFPFDIFWDRFAGVLPEDPTQPVLSGPIIHVVLKGETLYGIAIKYNTTIEAIKALNHFDSPSTLIIEGQRLLVKS